ncbi:MAG TPA: hypothetical protein VNA69_21620 [Thermoanaerobaculia bacterium]|nr:hypothetical protein [Thermoanaerobaculia bacterium]
MNRSVIIVHRSSFIVSVKLPAHMKRVLEYLVYATIPVALFLLGVAVFAYLIINGESNWYEGVQLLAVYAIIAVALFFLPVAAAPQPPAAPPH